MKNPLLGLLYKNNVPRPYFVKQGRFVDKKRVRLNLVHKRIFLYITTLIYQPAMKIWDSFIDLSISDKLALLTFIGAVISSIYLLLIKIVQYKKRLNYFNDLSSYYSLQELKEATKYYIPTYFQSKSTTDTDDPSATLVGSNRENLLQHLYNLVLRKTIVKNDESKYIIILADSGMGKTTFLINLYLYYRKKSDRFWGLAKFLTLFKTIYLIPLADSFLKESIDEIKDKKNSFLLLDALDEDPLALSNISKRLNDIVHLTSQFDTVIITCRTQFFSSEDEEPYKTGVIKHGGKKGQHVFTKVYLSPFTEKQIRKYLWKKYFLNFSKREEALDFVKSFPNVMVRPMLLSYIDDLLSDVKNKNSYYEVYKMLIAKWISREASRYNNAEEYKTKLYDFSKKISNHILQKMYENNRLTAEEIELFAQTYDIQLTNFEMKSKSLLNRDARGNYKFSHKSFMEFFLAENILNSPRLIFDYDYKGLDNVILFMHEMCKEKTFDDIISNSLTFKYITYDNKNGTSTFKSIIERQLHTKIKAIKFDVQYFNIPNFKYYLLSFNHLNIFITHLSYSWKPDIYTDIQRDIENVKLTIQYLERSLEFETDSRDIAIATENIQMLNIKLTSLLDPSIEFSDFDLEIINYLKSL